MKLSGTLEKAINDSSIPTNSTEKRILELQNQLGSIMRDAGASNLEIMRRMSKFDDELTHISEAVNYLMDESTSLWDYLDTRDAVYSSAAQDADKIVDHLEP